MKLRKVIVMLEMETGATIKDIRDIDNWQFLGDGDIDVRLSERNFKVNQVKAVQNGKFITVLVSDFEDVRPCNWKKIKNRIAKVKGA
uniref:Uncharacterized protein n=1 Tax=viral metagenome TaxID=1070528 RepID=A0A6M3IMU3_9ZZZZ